MRRLAPISALLLVCCGSPATKSGQADTVNDVGSGGAAGSSAPGGAGAGDDQDEAGTGPDRGDAGGHDRASVDGGSSPTEDSSSPWQADAGGGSRPSSDAGGSKGGPGGGDGDSQGGVDCGALTDRPLRSLVPSEYAAMCDCAAAAAGGYGKNIVCENSGYDSNESQKECVQDMNSFHWKPGCAATVRIVLQCISDLATCSGSSTPACTYYGSCVL